MGFSKKLEKETLNEWKKWYMDYNKLAGLINDEHEFIKHYLQEINKVEEFFKYAEREIVNGKKTMKDLFNIKNEEEIHMNTETENESKMFLIQPVDAGSCFGDTHSSTSSHSGMSSSTENESEKIKKEVPVKSVKIRKNDKTLKKIKEQIQKTQQTKKENINKEIIKEKIEESEVDEDREPDLEEEQEKKPVKLSWKEKILAQKDKLFLNNIFKRNYDKAKKEKALLDFIASAKHVIRFRNLNILGFRKILIKFDNLKNKNISYVLLPILEKAHFCRSREVDNSIKMATKKYTEIYYKNNPKKAKEILKNINRKEKANQINTFLCGVFLTISSFIHYNHFYDVKPGLKLNYYFSVLAILLGGLFFGICSVIFKFYSINSTFIFEFTVGSKFVNDRYLFYNSFLILIHQLTTLFLFDKTNSFLSLILVVIQILPVHFYYLRSRYYLVGTFIKVVGAPLFKVKFKHFFLADVICSFTLGFKLFLFSCDISKTSKLMILLLYPSTIRLLQCLRRYFDEGFKTQLYNALKYLCSIYSTSYSVLSGMFGKDYIWLERSLLSLSSSYSLIWDLLFDWNIFRNEYIFPGFLYFFIVLFNITARYIWIIKIYYPINDYYALLIEVLRRFLWLLIRVEIEHLYNCNKLTAMKYVNINREELFYVKDYEPLDRNIDSEATASNAEV